MLIFYQIVLKFASFCRFLNLYSFIKSMFRSVNWPGSADARSRCYGSGLRRGRIPAEPDSAAVLSGGDFEYIFRSFSGKVLPIRRSGKRTNGQKSFIFFRQNAWRVTENGVTCFEVPSGEQFPFTKKGKKIKNPLCNVSLFFPKRLRRPYRKDMIEREGEESVVCVLLRIRRSFARSRAFLSVFGRVHSTAWTLCPRLSPRGELSPAPCHYLYRAGPIGAPVVLASDG